MRWKSKSKGPYRKIVMEENNDKEPAICRKCKWCRHEYDTLYLRWNDMCQHPRFSRIVMDYQKGKRLRIIHAESAKAHNKKGQCKYFEPYQPLIKGVM